MVRSWWRHEQRSIAATVATMLHHSAGRKPHPFLVDAATQVGSQFSTTAVDPSAPHVVGSLPLVEEFTVPVYDQVHQDQFAAGEMEFMVEIRIVQEQVIVQAIPEVADSLPHDEQFTGPVYDQVHQELVASSEMTENFAEIPVVHEQVIVGLRPERLVDALGPQGELERAAPPCAVVPSLSLPSLGDDAGHDVTLDSVPAQVRLGSEREGEGAGGRD